MNLLKTPLQNAVVESLSSAPSSPTNGQMYYDTTLAQYRVYTNSAWVPVVAFPTAPTARQRLAFSTIMEKAERFTLHNSGSGTCVFGTTGLTLSTGATSSGYADFLIDHLPSTNITNQSAVFAATVTGSVNGDEHFIGVTSDSTFLNTGTTSWTKAHIGFRITRSGGNAQIYASMYDGTTLTQTLLTSPPDPSPSSVHRIYTIIRNSSSVEYYIEGVLYATHTTNLASDFTFLYLCGFARNGSNSSNVTTVVGAIHFSSDAGPNSTLTVAQGGTGATTLTGIVKGNGTSAFTAGTVAVADGGTGASDAATARTNLGVGSIGTLSAVSLTANVSGTLPIANGGTNATTALGAKNNLPFVDAYLAAPDTETGQTLADIGGLSFAINNGEVWSFEAHLQIGSSSNAGIKLGVNGPTGTLAAMLVATSSGTTLIAEQMNAINTANATALQSANAQTGQAHIHGTYVATATGTVQLRHLKVTSGTSTILAGSYLTARRIS